jgi:chloride channel protein, CIC family
MYSRPNVGQVGRDERRVKFNAVTRMTSQNAGMAVVSKAKRRPRIADVLGVITKEHIADSVAHTIKPYGE